MIYLILLLTLINAALVWLCFRYMQKAQDAAMDVQANVFWDFTEDGRGVIIRNRKGETMTIFKEPLQ